MEIPSSALIRGEIPLIEEESVNFLISAESVFRVNVALHVSQQISGRPVAPVAHQLPGISHVKLSVTRCCATRGVAAALASVALHCVTMLICHLPLGTQKKGSLQKGRLHDPLGVHLLLPLPDLTCGFSCWGLHGSPKRLPDYRIRVRVKSNCHRHWCIHVLVHSSGSKEAREEIQHKEFWGPQDTPPRHSFCRPFSCILKGKEAPNIKNLRGQGNAEIQRAPENSLQGLLKRLRSLGKERKTQ